MADEARWYVVHTYSGYENKVAATIEKTIETRKLTEEEEKKMLFNGIEQKTITGC